MQLALKVSANSIYGFMGMAVRQLPCLPIASAVTSYSQVLLKKMKEFVEENFTVAHDYKHNAVVVYGDTDSVMVKFGEASVMETFPLTIEAAEKCSAIFPKLIQLEFEKVSPLSLANDHLIYVSMPHLKLVILSLCFVPGILSLSSDVSIRSVASGIIDNRHSLTHSSSSTAIGARSGTLA